MAKRQPMVKGNMVTFTVQLNPQHCAELERVAAIQSTSRAAVVRQAVALWVAVNSTSTPDPQEERQAA